MLSILVTEDYGSWNQERGLTVYYKNVPNAKKRKNFRKAEIVVGVVLKDLQKLHITNFDDIS